MRRATLIAATSCLLICIAAYAHISGRFIVLLRAGHCTVEVNGAAIDGDVLAGRRTTLVTRRDKDKAHSYLLLYEGDVDRTGDIGKVIDCGQWVAPRLPILIQTSSYPKCEGQSGTAASRVSLTFKGTAERFTTAEQDVISIRR